MISLDDGHIKVLGHKANDQQKIGQRVGYMPQEAALVGELTVKETIHFFGNIFQMKSTRLIERFEMMKLLLELPPDDLQLEKCSGGEQRRVSFAAAIIHEPDLLVLDEPTVGLDPLLRHKIWNFLMETTRISKLSVIVTTHYTAEAQQSDRVGFMRDGVLIAEDSPSKVLLNCGTENLDEAFLKMCLKPISTLPLMLITQEKLQVCEHFNQPQDGKSSGTLRLKIVKELMKKHYRKFKRQPA